MSPLPPAGYPVRSTHVRFSGNVITVVSDEVAMPDGDTVVRDYVRHPGAVGVVALDRTDRVLLIRQYRHPVRRMLWELPAGLLDVAEESPLDTAKRELHEEGAIVADRWDLLADALTSPGSSDETMRLFLAREISAVPEADRFAGTAEEFELERHWVDLDEAAGWSLSGEIENAMCQIGVLAASRAREMGWTPLRPPGSAWSARGIG
ncbi:MAG: NUDIX hydrolase [Actinomycetota bacterium]|nr:NUDIX hydrolase [Actinomycetota bacterium]